MIRIKVSYDTTAELAALTFILGPYAQRQKPAPKKGQYNRIYIELDPEKLPIKTLTSPAAASDTKG